MNEVLRQERKFLLSMTQGMRLEEKPVSYTHLTLPTIRLV